MWLAGLACEPAPPAHLLGWRARSAGVRGHNLGLALSAGKRCHSHGAHSTARAVRAWRAAAHRGVSLRMADDGKEGGEAPGTTAATPAPPVSKAEETPAKTAEVKDAGAAKFDLKKTIDKSGAGFNQFDPVLSATRCPKIDSLLHITLGRRRSWACTVPCWKCVPR